MTMQSALWGPFINDNSQHSIQMDSSGRLPQEAAEKWCLSRHSFLASWEGCLTEASRTEQTNQRGGHMSRR